MKNKNSSKAGFTLIEILIAVLIIGVLTTIALPMYQGAVDKSKWARLIAPARAVSTAQEAAFMNYGGYTANMDDLDVSLPEGNDMTYTLYTTTNGDDANFVRIVSSQLDDVRLAKYYKNNEGFEDQLYCEAKNGNDRANKLCGKLLKGQELTSTDDDYKMYLVEERANEVLCNRLSLWWSKNFTNCYLTEEQRCTANTMPYGGGLCGWTNGQDHEINEGGTCEGSSTYGCKNSTINDGGTCVTTEGTRGYPCQYSIVNDGGKCIGNSTGAGSSCQYSTVNEGGECIGEGNGACQGSTINDGGTCIARSGTQSVCQNSIVNAGGECIAQTGSDYHSCTGTYNGGTCTAETGSRYGCSDSTFKEGGICDAQVGSNTNGGACYRSNFYDGSKCIGSGTSTCTHAKFHDGAVCEGNASGACGGNNLANNWAPSFQAGSTCNANVAGTCKNDSFMAGSTCNGYANDTCARGGSTFAGTCNGYAEGACGTGATYRPEAYNVTFTDGAVCNGHVSGSCKGIFASGSRCVANVAGACAGTYKEGSCCQGGDNCPANAPRC